eukprot:7391900-Prymnesium_polylepis.1
MGDGAPVDPDPTCRSDASFSNTSARSRVKMCDTDAGDDEDGGGTGPRMMRPPRSVSFERPAEGGSLLDRAEPSPDLNRSSDVLTPVSSQSRPSCSSPAASRMSGGASPFAKRLSHLLPSKSPASVRRVSRLHKLHRITSSKAYRSSQRDSSADSAGSATSDELAAALGELQQMVSEDKQVSVDSLCFVRKLGEGAFADVQLHELVAPVEQGGGAKPVQIAVKVMKTKVPGPIDHMTGEVQQMPVPAAWRASFQAEVRRGLERGCPGRATTAGWRPSFAPPLLSPSLSLPLSLSSPAARRPGCWAPRTSHLVPVAGGADACAAARQRCAVLRPRRHARRVACAAPRD